MRVTTRPVRHQKGSGRASKGEYCQRDKTPTDARRDGGEGERVCQQIEQREEREKDYVARVHGGEEKYAGEVELVCVHYVEEH